MGQIIERRSQRVGHDLDLANSAALIAILVEPDVNVVEKVGRQVKTTLDLFLLVVTPEMHQQPFVRAIVKKFV